MTEKEAIKIVKPILEQCKGSDGCMGYIEKFFSTKEEKAIDIVIAILERNSAK